MTKRTPHAEHTRRAFQALERWGFLLIQDAKLPSVATMIAGDRIRGSWWGHPRGEVIFHTIGDLEDCPDVLTAKLLAGKVTLVHRRHWRALAAIGRARESWQLRMLTPDARRLLERVDAERRLRASGTGAKLLEQALLVASRQVHTKTGAHALELTAWDAFARRARLSAMPVECAKAELEEALAVLNREFEGRATLPWPSSSRT